MRLLAIALVLLLLTAWGAALFFPEWRWVAIALTLLLVLALLAMVVGRWWMARHKAAVAEREAAASASPERRPEIVALRAEMRRTFAAATRDRVGIASGRRAASKVPWYIVLGAPGSGKTACLDRSDMVLAVSGRAKEPSLATAKTFEWRTSQDAVILDTAGRLAVGDTDRDEWLALLAGVRELRRGRGVDGVLLFVDAMTLVADTKRADLAARLRGRIDDLVAQLEVTVPVYLLLTKTDRMPGFFDFWSDLAPPERSLALGAAFAVDDDRMKQPQFAVQGEFDAIVEAMHTRVLDRLPAERDPERRARVLRFPLEVRALRDPLSQFAEVLCRRDPSRQGAIFRGFYLTSAVPTAAPGEQSALFANRSTRVASNMRDESSYFLADVFRYVILPDRNLTAQSDAGGAKQTQREVRAAVISLGVAVGVLAPATLSYVHNASLAAQVDQATHVQGRAESVPGTRGDPIEAMADALDHIDQDAYAITIPGWFGPRAARELLAPLRQAYVDRIHATLLGRVRPLLDRELDTISATVSLADVPAAPDSVTPLREAYDTLRFYGMLVEPTGHIDVKWAAPRLARLWGRSLSSEVVPRERLEKHTVTYLKALEETPALAWPPAPSMHAARDRLVRLDIRGLPYRRALLWARDEQPVRVRDIFSATSLEFLDCRGDVQIPGAFTANGWMRVQVALRASTPWPVEAVVQPWVVADARLPTDDAAMRNQIREQYFDDYSRHWMAFLDELRVKTPNNAVAARAELAALKDDNGFYKSLFKQFRINAIREDEAPPESPSVASLWSRLPWVKTDVDSGTKTATVTPVEKSFRPLLVFSGDVDDKGGAAAGPSPLDKYRVILDKLKAALDAPPSDKVGGDPQTQFSEASTGVGSLLDGTEEPTRSRLARLLMPPVMGGVTVAKMEGVSTLSNDWKTGVWTAWNEQLNGHYPFKAGAHSQPANFADFAAFFRPQTGILWKFVTTRLADWVELGGRREYTTRRGAEPLPDDILQCLTVAQSITDAFFPDGEDPGMRFSVQADWSAPDVTDAKISIAGKDTPLGKGQWSTAIKWFGDDARLAWTQTGRPTEELGRHSFSLLDLFDQLGGLKPSDSSRRGLYAIECPPLTLKVRSDGKRDPFGSDFFTHLQCPDEIRVGRP